MFPSSRCMFPILPELSPLFQELFSEGMGSFIKKTQVSMIFSIGGCMHQITDYILLYYLYVLFNIFTRFRQSLLNLEIKCLAEKRPEI